MITCVIKYITFLFMVIYLSVQAKHDIKTMKVFTQLNNAALLITGLPYIISLIAYRSLPDTGTILMLVGIILLHIAGLYGIGDAKAMAAMFISTRFLYMSYQEPNVFLFLVGMFVCEVSFLICGTAKRLKEKRKYANKNEEKHVKKRAAFFPFLLIGYIVMLILGS